jgi:hypothetical protein
LGVDTSSLNNPLFTLLIIWLYSVQPVVLFNVFLPASISGSNKQLVEPGVGHEHPAALFSVHCAVSSWEIIVKEKIKVL